MVPSGPIAGPVLATDPNPNVHSSAPVLGLRASSALNDEIEYTVPSLPIAGDEPGERAVTTDGQSAAPVAGLSASSRTEDATKIVPSAAIAAEPRTLPKPLDDAQRCVAVCGPRYGL